MDNEIKTVPLVRMHPGIPCRAPDPKASSARLQDPAQRVMTDFAAVTPITVEPIVGIDLALRKMKDAGVRLLLVTDVRDNIAGVITSHDIQGEKPVKYSEEFKVHHGSITVEQIMTPLERMPAVDFSYVQQSLVRHIVETMRELDRQHLLVVEAHAGGQRIRGMYSTTQIGKMLNTKIFDPMHAANSLADMQHDMAHY